MSDSAALTTRVDGRSTPSTVAAGVLGGGAYLLGYVATYLLASDPVRASVARRLVEFVTGDPATWKLVGWVFYAAHFVETVLPGLFGSSRTVDLVAAIDAVPVLVYLVPPVALAASGALLARWAGAAGVRRGPRRARPSSSATSPSPSPARFSSSSSPATRPCAPT
ncbi:hypothetical protein ACFQJD_11955 [Haloplanus sp. GCM10025708]|uniref:hypothetical protein n=1 Tax=Haloferacaceae TaxID=1644056 RepID=UPI0036084A85